MAKPSASPANVISHAPARRNQKDERTQSLSAQQTKSLLMDAGEKLIGKYGFDGVTLRDIADLAGQANSSVVQYHFKDKAGLIEAIFEDRMHRREELRKQRLDALKASDEKADPRRLLQALWLPSLAFQDADGGYVFCHFALQCLSRTDLHVRFPAHEVFETWRKFPGRKTENVVLAEVMELLRAHYSNVPSQLLARRLSALSLMFIANVVEFDNAPGKSRNAKFDPEPLLDMAIAALSAPAS